jgi:hypothetical protein
MLLASTDPSLLFAVGRLVRDKTNPSGVEAASIIELKTKAVIIRAVVAVYGPVKIEGIGHGNLLAREILRGRGSDHAT